jgi:uncharacterized iron-regulated membrane protein
MVTQSDSENDVVKEKNRARIKRNRLWFRLHSFIGLNLSLFLGFVFLTGTLAVFANEIDWMLQPEMRASAVVSADDLPWEAIGTALADYAPDAEIETIEASESPILAPTAYLIRSDGGIRTVYFDTETGAVQGEGVLFSAKSLLRAIHSRLLMRDPPGTAIVSVLSLFLLTSLVSAMLAYKKWWRGFFRIPRLNRGRRVFWGDIHLFAGTWSLVFGLLMAITGIWYLAEETAVPAPGFSDAVGPGGKVSNGEAAALLPASLSAARRAYPELHIRRIMWPGTNGASFGFYGQDGTVLARPRANGVLVDVFDATIIDRHSAADGTMHQRISEAADPLHMGFFAGYWSKTLWFLFGALLTLLAFSGAMVFVRRLAPRNGNRSASAATSANGRWAWLRLRGGLGVGAIIAASVIGTMLYLLPGEIAILR